MRRPGAPRRFGAALRGVREEVAPETLLAAVQTVWAEALGERIGAEARPVAEREGVVTVECRASTWAQELDLLSGELLERLNRALAARAGTEGADVKGLRFRSTGA